MSISGIEETKDIHGQSLSAWDCVVQNMFLSQIMVGEIAVESACEQARIPNFSKRRRDSRASSLSL